MFAISSGCTCPITALFVPFLSADSDDCRAIGISDIIIISNRSPPRITGWGNASKTGPEDVTGKPYQRWMLPYAGGVVRGKIAFAVSEEDHQEKMNRLKTIHP